MLPPVVLALAVSACGGSSSNTATAPTATTRCAVALRSDTPSLAADGGTGTVTITVNRECPWEASTDVGWIAVTTSRAGQGDATVNYTVASNPQPQVRRGQIIVNDARVEITQAGTACTLALDATVGAVGPEGGSLRVAVAGLSGCAWTAVSQAGWVRVASGGSGDGSGGVTLEVAANAGEPRTGGVVIAGQVYTVAQGSAPPAAPPGPGCAYAVQPSTLVVPAGGGTATVNVGTGATCSWTVGVTAGWLTVAGPATRQGPSGISITVAPNTDNAVRSGTLAVAGQTVLVVQDAAPPLTPPVTPPPSPPNCSYSVTPPTQPIAASGGGTILNVVAPAGCAWTATSTVDWLLVFGGASGEGSGTVSISSAANPATSARTGNVVVAGQSIPVTQAGTADPMPSCTFTVSPTAQSIGASGGTGEVTVTTSAPACGWTATSSAPWVTVTNGAQGTGGGVVTYLVTPNEAQTARSAVLTVAGRTVVITQDAASPGACTYQLSPPGLSVDAAGGEAVTRLDTAAQCAWTAASQADWISVIGSTSGSGSADIRVLVAANPATTPRTGTVAIGSQALQVTQAGATGPLPTCTFTVSPSSQGFDAAGGASQVAIAASEASCTWTAQSNAHWISLTSAAQGTGSGVVGYQVAANETTTARSGTLTVAGQSVTVSQAGAAAPPPTCTFTVSPSSQSFDAAGGASQVAITASEGACTWTAQSDAPWISLTSAAQGSGSGVVGYQVAANETTSDRLGTLTVAGQTVTISQVGADPPPPACTYQLSPSSLTVEAAGGNTTARLETQPDCTWTAVSQATWITLASSPGGSGSADIVVTVAPNTTTTSRTGTVTVADQTLQITQAGATDQTTELEGSIGMLAGACPNVTFRVGGRRVAANAATTYEDGTCSTLRNGTEVQVTGTPQPDGSLLATHIEVND